MRIFCFILLLLMSIGAMRAQEVPTVNYAEFNKILDSLEHEGTVLVNFWATWCKPCVEELPHLQRALLDFDRILPVFVSMDFPSQKRSKLIPFIEKEQLPGFHLLLDDTAANEWISKVDETWSGAIPATLLVRDGHKTFHEGKFSNYAQLRTFLLED